MDSIKMKLFTTFVNQRTFAMEQLVIIDKEYASWIVELAQRYRSSQIKAATKVNDEMLRFYWSVGEDIEKRQWKTATVAISMGM